MRHNQQVADNIRQISQQVEEAESQDDLVQIIQSVEQHPGPLDYNDRLNYFLAGFLSLSVIYCVYNILFTPLHYLPGTDLIDSVFRSVIGFSALWAPALLNLYLAIWLDDWAVKKMKLDRYLPKAEMRFAAAFAAPIALFYYLPSWHYFYWGLLELIGSLLPFYYEEQITGFVLLSLLMLFFLSQFLYSRRNWREGISKRIFLLDTLFNNNLKDLRSQCSSRYSDLSEQFADFKRGNDTRELTSLYQGHHEGEVHQFDYQIYCFHYVVKTTSTSTDSDGNTTTTTTRRSYYRHGLLVPFPFAHSLLLSADGKRKTQGAKYKTASNSFNKQFRINTQDEMAAARFLNPAVIEKLSGLEQQVRKPVLEISPGKLLCLAFNDDDLIRLQREHSLKDPQAFAEEISGHADLQKLYGLLDLIHDLMRLTDNNFGGDTEHKFDR